jgi:flagellar biosynthesis GTPase FlhF
MQKKQVAEKRMPESTRAAMLKQPAERQAEYFEKAMDDHLSRALSQSRDEVQVSGRKPAAPAKASPAAAAKVTSRRYIDIPDDDVAVRGGGQAAHAVSALKSGAGAVTRGAADPKMGVEEELRHLKRMVEEMKSAQEDVLHGSGAQALVNHRTGAAGGLTPALQDGFEQLVINGVDKRYALTLAKKVAFELGTDGVEDPERVLDQLASEIMSTTEILPAMETPASGAAKPVVVALVGPTGVGKTTTLAKMASEALLKRNLKVGLINVDSYKVAAFDQLATYAKILNVPFRSAASKEDLQAAIRDFQGLDLVFVDTTGRSQRDPVALREMEDLLHSVPELQTQLVLSATTRDAELYDMASRFSIFHPQGLIFSKLDEATSFGCVYNVSQRSKLPLLYFTTGQRVPEDIEEATRERVVALVLDL